MTFNDFLEITKSSIENGEIKISKPLSKFDMAILFAEGQICDRKGVPCTCTLSEIHNEILTFADETIYEENEGWFYDKEETK